MNLYLLFFYKSTCNSSERVTTYILYTAAIVSNLLKIPLLGKALGLLLAEERANIIGYFQVESTFMSEFYQNL